MNIAFVFPEVYDVARYGKRRKEFPPFGVLYLATIVSQQKGMNVQVFTVESKDTALDLTTFDVVAFCIPSSVTYHVIEGVRYNSTYMDGALLIAGGVHVNFFPAITLRDLAVHAVGVGNSDETILELIAQKDTRQFQDIKGICFDDKGRAVRTPNRPLKSSLDHLPAIPNRSLLPDQDIVSRRLAGTDLKMVHVMFSQGCPFVCNFCAAAQRKLLYRSGAHIVRELEHLACLWDRRIRCGGR